MLTICRKSVINVKQKAKKESKFWNLSQRSHTSQCSTNVVPMVIFSLAHTGILLPSLLLEVILNIFPNNQRRCYIQKQTQKSSLSHIFHENIWPSWFGFIWQEFAGCWKICISCWMITIKVCIANPTQNSVLFTYEKMTFSKLLPREQRTNGKDQSHKSSIIITSHGNFRILWRPDASAPYLNFL